jgi:hypothetical protein
MRKPTTQAGSNGETSTSEKERKRPLLVAEERPLRFGSSDP